MTRRQPIVAAQSYGGIRYRPTKVDGPQNPVGRVIDPLYDLWNSNDRRPAPWAGVSYNRYSISSRPKGPAYGDYDPLVLRTISTPTTIAIVKIRQTSSIPRCKI